MSLRGCRLPATGDSTESFEGARRDNTKSPESDERHGDENKIRMLGEEGEDDDEDSWSRLLMLTADSGGAGDVDGSDNNDEDDGMGLRTTMTSPQRKAGELQQVAQGLLASACLAFFAASSAAVSLGWVVGCCRCAYFAGGLRVRTNYCNAWPLLPALASPSSSWDPCKDQCHVCVR